MTRKKINQRSVKFALTIIFFITVLTPYTKAYSFQTEQEIDLSPLIEALPDEVIANLPENFFYSHDAVSIAEKSDLDLIGTFVLNVIKNILPAFFKRLCSLTALILTVSLVSTAKKSLASPQYTKTIDYITLICISVYTYDFFGSLFSSTDSYLKSINTIVNALIPIMTVLYTLGGNAATAAINSAGTAFMLAITNELIITFMYPIIKTSLGLSLASSIGNFQGISHITKTVKNIFTVILSGTVTLMSVFLIFKTNIAATADGVTARTIKFAGSFIPVIGSALGESVRSLMSGISLIKSSVGFVGILIIIFVTLPPLVNILLNKLTVELSIGVSSLLGCENECSVLKEISSAIGFLTAVSICISVLFILELTVFVTVSPALGGY